MLNEGGYGKRFTSSWKRVPFSPHTWCILTENNMFDLGECNLRRWQNIKNSNTIQVSHWKTSNERKTVSFYPILTEKLANISLGKIVPKSIFRNRLFLRWHCVPYMYSYGYIYRHSTFTYFVPTKPSNCQQLFVDKHAFINTRFEDTDDIFFDKWQ